MNEFWEKYKTAIIVTSITLFAVAVLLFFIYRKDINNFINTTMDTFKFSANVAGHLNKLNPAYKNTFEKFVQGVIDMGYTPQINSSYRTFSEQQYLWEKDNRNAKAGYSYHNYGLAIDMQVTKDGKKYGKSSPSKAEWIATGIPALAESMGIYWGGNIAGYYDAVHFDIRKYSTKTLLAMAFEKYGSNVQNIKGNELNIA